jgi:hypothetical protein
VTQRSRELRQMEARFLIRNPKMDPRRTRQSCHIQCATKLFRATAPVLIQRRKAVGSPILLIAWRAIRHMHERGWPKPAQARSKRDYLVIWMREDEQARRWRRF